MKEDVRFRADHLSAFSGMGGCAYPLALERFSFNLARSVSYVVPCFFP